MPENQQLADRLLILSCSQRKRPDQNLLPAIERYDGPAFRVLRRFLRESPSEAPDVLILSAKFGLIPHDLSIPAYDRKMSPLRAHEISMQVASALSRILDARLYREAFIFAGRDYLKALDDAPFGPRVDVEIAGGTIGRKLAKLRDWLHGELRLIKRRSDTRIRVWSDKPPRLRGIEVALTPEQVLSVARRALMKDPQGAARYRSWYVVINGRRVAPKWLVSQVTDLPVSDFQAREARRLLLRLGIEVRSV